MNQHDLLDTVLRAAGGLSVQEIMRGAVEGKNADILFPAANVIVEIKSLTTDRAASPETSDAVGRMFADHVHMGAPIITEPVTISLYDLPAPVAANTLRIAGRRVQMEAKAANRQIKATRTLLGRPDALGVLAIITPPFRLDRRSVAWLVGDMMREGRCSGIDELLLVETTIASGDSASGSSFISRHSRDGGSRSMPPDLVDAIGLAWGRVSGQAWRPGREEDYHRYGATS